MSTDSEKDDIFKGNLILVTKHKSGDVQNAPERIEYQKVLKSLSPILYDLPPKIISIDGRPGVGKTTLGRFLAWRFNTTLMETDLFLFPNLNELKYRLADIGSIIQSRLDSDLPILVEGVVSLRILGELGKSPDFHIHVICEDSDEPFSFEGDLKHYELTYPAAEFADLMLNLPAL